jgi:hypothetical protein
VTLHALAGDHFPEGMEPLDCEPAMAPKGVHAAHRLCADMPVAAPTPLEMPLILAGSPDTDG